MFRNLGSRDLNRTLTTVGTTTGTPLIIAMTGLVAGAGAAGSSAGFSPHLDFLFRFLVGSVMVTGLLNK